MLLLFISLVCTFSNIGDNKKTDSINNLNTDASTKWLNYLKAAFAATKKTPQ